MRYKTLIETADLAGHLDDPSWAVVDCRFKLDDPGWGEAVYADGHIPGAVYAHLDRDLSGARTGVNGRHPLPAAEALRATLGRFGIDAGVQVVAYDHDNGMFASRLWWLLRWLGHEGVAVLNGGFAKWLAESRPVRSGRDTRPGRTFRGEPRRELVATLADVSDRFRDPAWRLIDARAPERYRGEIEPLDRVPGHIPGATNHFFKLNLTAEGTFRSPEELRAPLLTAIAATPPDRVIAYCGSGVTACHNLLALEHAGIPGARLYPGSWSEWSSDAERPVERSES